MPAPPPLLITVAAALICPRRRGRGESACRPLKALYLSKRASLRGPELSLCARARQTWRKSARGRVYRGAGREDVCDTSRTERTIDKRWTESLAGALLLERGCWGMEWRGRSFAERARTCSAEEGLRLEFRRAAVVERLGSGPLCFEFVRRGGWIFMTAASCSNHLRIVIFSLYVGLV